MLYLGRKYKAFRRQGVNLHPKYRFDYQPESNALTFREKDAHLPLFQGRPLGEITGLIGPNGAGKSTVYDLIIQLFRVFDQNETINYARINELGVSYGDKPELIFLYVFEIDAQKEPWIIGAVENLPTDNRLSSYAFKLENRAFLVYVNRWKSPSLSCNNRSFNKWGLSVRKKGLDPLTQFQGLYYNHTLEDLARKLGATSTEHDLERGRSSLRIIPTRVDGAISSALVEQEISRGLVQLYADESFRDSRAKKFCESIWRPKYVTLQTTVELGRKDRQGDNEADSAFQLAHFNLLNLKEEKYLSFSKFFSRYTDGKNMRLANAVGMLGRILKEIAWSEKCVDYIDGTVLDLKRIVESETWQISDIIAPIKEIEKQGHLEQHSPFPGTYELKRQLKNGLFFDENIDKALGSLNDGHKLIIDMEHIAEYKDFLLELPEWFELDFSDKKHGGKRLASLSGGERLSLQVLLNVNRALRLLHAGGATKILLLMDEADLGLHPEWQRKIISLLHEGLGADDQSIQLIYATHSPFVASDLPHTHLTLMERDKNGFCREKTDHQMKTFGGNIHELLADSFFLKSTIGAFARTAMREVFVFCGDVHQRYQLLRDPDYGESDNLKKSVLKKRLLQDKKAYRSGSLTDYQSRKRMKKLEAIMGESYLSGMLANNIGMLDRIFDELDAERES